MCTLLQPSELHSNRIPHEACSKTSLPKRSFDYYTSYSCTSEQIHVQDSTCCRCYAVLRHPSPSHGRRCPIGPSYDRQSAVLVAPPWQRSQKLKCLTKCVGLNNAWQLKQKWTNTSSGEKTKNKFTLRYLRKGKAMKNHSSLE